MATAPLVLCPFGCCRNPCHRRSWDLVSCRCRPYVAPEQAAWARNDQSSASNTHHKKYDHKADMWSLGVIFFEMLAPR
ncbi:unnamed protein product, partial [Discosporangium mesarthrocarpum]